MRTLQTELLRSYDPHGRTNQDGIIVWDQKGIVIMWQDGHRSRFSWQALRRNCMCADCQPQSLKKPVVERNAA